MKHVRRVSAASHVFICVPFIRTSFSSVFIYVGLQKREIHVNVVSSRVAGVCRQVEADKCVVRPLCFAGCVKTSLSASSLHDGHVRTSRCKQPPNCNVCSVPTLVKSPSAANEISNRLRVWDVFPDSAVGLSRYR